MDYKFVYNCIISKAKNRTELSEYYEKHHILPKSLGGSNDETNLVKLTAREHFICHWLLVKMYEKGSVERKKMLFAFWRMKSNPDNNGKRYINSRAYETFRMEFAQAVGDLTRSSQLGELNSQYGKKWFTNYETGESRSFFEKPNEKWIEGRWLFNGQTSELKFKVKSIQRIKTKVSHKFRSFKLINKVKQTELETMNMWDDYHSGNYKSLRDYEKQISISLVALRNRFIKFIPIFLQMRKKGKEFPSNKSFVGVYS